MDKIRKLFASDGDGGRGPSVSHSRGGSGRHYDSGEAARVLVLINENSPVISALLFLRKRGYKIKVIHRLMDTLTELSKNEPDVLLISWNLKKTDVKKVYNLLSSKFSTLCIVFGEDNNTKTSATMMSSGIPHTLLPPVSGPGMHMRISALLRKRRTLVIERKQIRASEKFFVQTPPDVSHLESDDLTPNKNKKGKDLEDDLGLIGIAEEDLSQIKAENIPADTKWDGIQAGYNNDETIWRGKSEEDGKKAYYFFQGPEAPHYDAVSRNWSGFGTVNILRSEKDINAKLLGQLQTHTESAPQRSVINFENDDLSDGKPKTKQKDTNIFGEELQLELQKALVDEDSSTTGKNKKSKVIMAGSTEDINLDDEGNGNITVQGITDFSKPINDKQYEAVTTLKTKQKKTILAQSLQKAVASVIRPSETGEALPIDILTKVTVTMIKTSKYQGYLVGANASDIPDYTLMEEVMEKLGVVLQDSGEPLTPTTGILELELDPLPFMLWVESKAEFYVKSKHGNNEVAYAYIPFENMPEVVEAGDTDVLIGVKLSSLHPGKSLLFDVYIHMPKNNKYLLYLKKGTVMETKTLTKLIKFSIKHLYIKKADIDLYQTYCAKHKIAESYEEFKIKKAS